MLGESNVHFTGFELRVDILDDESLVCERCQGGCQGKVSRTSYSHLKAKIVIISTHTFFWSFVEKSVDVSVIFDRIMRHLLIRKIW